MAIDVNNIVQFYQGTSLPTDAVNHPNRVYFIKSGDVGSLYKGNVLIAQTNNDTTIQTIQSSIAALDKELDDHVTLYNALVKLVQENSTAIEGNTTAISGIKNGAGINDFAAVETALAGKQAVGDYATKAEAKGYADAKDTAIAAAQKAGDDAQAAADKAQGDVDNLKVYVGTIPEGATSTNITDWVVERTSGIATDQALTELTNRVDTAEDKIEAVENKLVNIETTVVAEIAEQVEAEKTRAEGVEGELRTAVNSKAAQTALEAEVARATGVEAGLNTRLEEVETFFELAEGEKLNDALDTLVEIQNYITNEGEAADQMVQDIAKNAEDIQALEEAYQAADAAINKEIEALEAAVDTKAAAADLADLTGRVTTAEGKITTLEGKMTAVEGVAEKNKTDIATANAEIAKKANQADLTELTGRVSTAEVNITNLQNDLNTAETGVKARLTAVEGKATDNATAIGNNSSDISALVAALQWHQA